MKLSCIEGEVHEISEHGDYSLFCVNLLLKKK